MHLDVNIANQFWLYCIDRLKDNNEEVKKDKKTNKGQMEFDWVICQRNLSKNTMYDLQEEKIFCTRAQFYIQKHITGEI